MPKKGKYSVLEQRHALQQTPCGPELKIEIYVTKTSLRESLHQNPSKLHWLASQFPTLVKSK